MISDSVKKQGQEYQKLHENRQLALFRNTPPQAAGILYLVIWMRFEAGHDAPWRFLQVVENVQDWAFRLSPAGLHLGRRELSRSRCYV